MRLLSLLSLSFIMACNSPEPQQPAVEALLPAELKTATFPIHLSVEQQVPDTRLWQEQMQQAVDGTDGMVAEAYFCSRFDSSLVFALLRSGTAVGLSQFVGKWNAANAIAPTLAYLQNMDTMDVNFGAGDIYIYVSHPVKDFDHWHTTYLSLESYKGMDSIYGLGLFRGVTSPETVSVLSRSVSLVKASDYSKVLDESGILKAAGVTGEPNASVWRRLQY
ncbi:MAG: hypothetical protein K9J06_15210 [Flavobacteriales bacterium]|nr:hypothetical protein [Flavobacteriales bacterium]